MPYALKVTEETIDYILGFGAALGFSLDYIKDDLLYYGESEKHTYYIITDGKPEIGNVTFTTMIAPDFFRNWKFYYETSDKFSEIVPVETRV